MTCLNDIKEEEKENRQEIYEKQFFKWQRPDKTSYKNNFGLIEDICDKPLKTMFSEDNKEIKDKMINGDLFNNEYVVDVEVLYKNNKIYCYNILKLYDILQ